MIKGIIFDMDGVISDTQRLHSCVESNLLSRYGVRITPDKITAKYSGVRTREFFDELLRFQGVEYNIDLLMLEKWERMERMASVSIDPIEGSIDLIKKLAADKYSLSIASASNLNYVRMVLKNLGIIDYFSYIIGGDMVENGKPDPEIFLLASTKMGIIPENCLVIEDGISGMLAAAQGGMQCIGLVKDLNSSYPTKNLVISLSEITPEYINKIS